MPVVKIVSRIRSMISTTGIFVYKELISKLEIKLALDRVRKVFAKSYDFFKIYGFTTNCGIRGSFNFFNGIVKKS